MAREPISAQEMMRQLHAFAMEEMRNRGIEEAAKFIDRRNAPTARDRFDLGHLAASIRSLKRDPAKCLSDWWGDATPSSGSEG